MTSNSTAALTRRDQRSAPAQFLGITCGLVWRPLLSGAGFHLRRRGGAPFGEFRYQPPRRADLVCSGARVLLRPAPAFVRDVEDHPVRIVEFDLVKAAALDVRLAHQPPAARLLDALPPRDRPPRPRYGGA